MTSPAPEHKTRPTDSAEQQGVWEDELTSQREDLDLLDDDGHTLVAASTRSGNFTDEIEEQAPEPVANEPTFGPYQLMYQIASGGMGTVFLARELGPGSFARPVALKRIHPHLARRRKFVDMFLDEAAIVSRINHPNVCRIYDFGDYDGTYYLAMEYLQGETLAGLMNVMSKKGTLFDKPQWHAIAATLIANAAEGLHAAHELRDDNGQLLGVVHRDVSPHNLFVTYDGNIRVLDFGVAFATDRLHHSTTGTVKGKYAYMSPEQIKTRVFDRRADVWALGVCLWEMLTARRLFRRAVEVDTIMAVSGAAIAPPSLVRASIPPQLEQIVMKALSRNPDDRYPTARELGRELIEFVRTQTKPAGPADISEWIEQLFHNQRIEKKQMVQTVLERPPEIDQAPEPARARGALINDLPTVVHAHDLGANNGPSPHPHTPRYRGGGQKRPHKLVRSRTNPWIGMSIFLFVTVALFALVQYLPKLGDDPTLPSQDGSPKAVVPVALRAVTPQSEPEQTTSSPSEPASSSPDTKTAASSRSNVPTQPREKNTKTGRKAQGAPGYVNLVTPGGWADIYEGDRLLGRSPHQFLLPEGKHTLRIVPFGTKSPIRRVVYVEPSQTHRIRIAIP